MAGPGRMLSVVVSAGILALAAAAPASGAFGYLSSFGTYGTGDGQFADAKGIAVGPDGNLYVADAGNSRILVVTPTGEFVRKWGSAGTGDGQFRRLLDVVVAASGNVYTTEGNWGGEGNNQIQRFAADGTFTTRWGSSSDLNGIWALDVDAAENVYVADAGANRVVKFNSTGTELTRWGSKGAAPGQFNQISAIAVDAAGDVYTVEAADGPSPNNVRVQKFDANGVLQDDFGGTSSFPIGTSDTLPNPLFNGIDVDAAGSIYLAGHHILRFTAAGAPAERLIDCQGGDAAAHPNGKVYATASSGVVVLGEGGTACAGNAPVRLIFEGDESVTVNSGAQYTNDPNVQLTIEPAANTTSVRISNDGGFATASTVLVAASRQYAWMLDSSGPERLPKTVYVRFANDTESSSQNFTDDIILDQTPPVIEEAAAAPRSVFAELRAATPVPTYTLSITASDNASGVAGMQITGDKDAPGAWKAYAASTRFSTGAASIFVRVRDGAGNASDWRTVRTDTRAPATRIVSGPSSRTRSRTARFRFVSSEAGSRFRCKLDTRRYRACTSPKTYRRLTRGTHRFRVRATDRAGNTDRTPATRSWTIRRR